MKFKLVLVFLLLSGYVKAQNINIIPQPQSVVMGTGQFSLNSHAAIGLNDAALLPLAIYFKNEVARSNNLTLAVNNTDAAGLIHLRLVKGDTLTGAYQLNIDAKGIVISSSNKEGVFYGLVSLLQLIKDQPQATGINLPSVTITDGPRYQWRGLMLDEARHFFGKEKVKQLLDWMAYYKLNKFHWHLTDVQGWRIEIKKYPKLTSVGAIGNYSDTLAPAKYYTQADIKEIVAYAAERSITVIPEIDMPGHATAANKAYPQFSGGSVPGYENFTFNPVIESTYQYLADIIKETNVMFQAKMIHLGGDEVALGVKAWSLNPAIAAFMQKNNFADVGALERYFFKRMADTVTTLNSKVLAWDEAAATNLAPDKTIIFWWRQNLPGQLHLALQKGYQVVLCPRLPLYFDFVQDADHVSGRRWNGVFNRVTDVYDFPEKEMGLNADLQSKQIIGVQANVWTETIGSEKRLDFMIFPRIAGLAEAGWTAPGLKDDDSFNNRLKASIKIYDSAGIYYFDPFDPFFHPESVDFTPKINDTEALERHSNYPESRRRTHGRSSGRSRHTKKGHSSGKTHSSKKSHKSSHKKRK